MRKVVTVLFCDVAGSTAFADRVDAETARETLAEYHAVSKEAIESHGGTVAKFIGDGVMATFGLPEVATDDAERAVLAGLELQRRFTALRDRVVERHGADLGLRVGVNTGEVATGTGDADLVGDVLNTAARIEAAAPPGGVLVGEATWRLTRATVAYEAGGEVDAKGKAEPLATFLANGVPAAAAEVATPFVGRDDELAVLADALGQARGEGTAVVVTVIGAPGVGKTRLAAEFVDREGREVLAYDLRCEQAGATTFAPIADLVRAAAGLTVSQTDDEQRAGIAQLLGPSLPEASRLVDLLASFVGVAPAPSTEEAFYAVRRLCEQLAADRPLVLVVDDIQWAEPRLLDLIEHLGEWVGAPVVIVNLARPEIREVRPTLAEAGRRVRAVVPVGGLDAAATRRLAAELLGAALPPELTDRLGTSTDGNPLFVRELVRMLVDDGVLVRADDGWDLTVDLEAVEVPPTIQSLLATRVERLPPEERRLIELAAVVGPEFALGAVAALAGLPAEAVAATLEGLRRKDVVESTGTYRGDEPVLRFHHILIRDAAYRRLLKKTRAQLHQRVGEWTERTSVSLTGDHEAAIAHHLERASRYRLDLGLDDAETAALGRRAAALLQVAAASSLARDDLPAAGAFAVRALALLPVDATGRDELLLLACEALLGVGDVAGAVEPLAELAASGDERTVAWADCFAGEVVALSDPERLAEAEVSVDAAAERLARLEDPAGVAKARQVRALLLV
ncbi:MAG TPA: adenylate/guanylate cyclase domain-containing protein, partial [Acidimicrobiales bacterium]|nr:adenylate/guanylate cyclase domain-containing protein [Acidimicrobiales bacterium]